MITSQHTLVLFSSLLFFSSYVFGMEQASSSDTEQQLILAAQANDLTLLQDCLTKRAQVNAQEPNTLMTALYSACARKDYAVPAIRLLVSNDANPNIANAQGRTAVHAAAAHNNTEVLELLCQAGALLNAQDNEGLTPAHVAATIGAHKAIAWLNQKGADMNIRNKQGEAPIHSAIREQGPVSIRAKLLHQLLLHGARLDIVTCESEHRDDSAEEALTIEPTSFCSTVFHLEAEKMQDKRELQKLLLYHALLYPPQKMIEVYDQHLKSTTHIATEPLEPDAFIGMLTSKHQHVKETARKLLQARATFLRQLLEMRNNMDKRPCDIEQQAFEEGKPNQISLYDPSHINGDIDLFLNALENNAISTLPESNVCKVAYKGMPISSIFDKCMIL